MNREICKFLMNNLEEVHNTFIFVVDEMKKNNISFSYDIVEEMEMNSYREIKVNLSKMNYCIFEYKGLKDYSLKIYLFHDSYNHQGYYFKTKHSKSKLIIQ